MDGGGDWRRGDEPYGEFTYSAEVARAGSAGKLAYDLPAETINYVVFLAPAPVALPGSPTGVRAWVYGDGSGHFLNVWIRDGGGEIRQYTFGRVWHRGWQAMTAWFNDNAPWPQGHISGPDNGRLDDPVYFYALVFDGVPDGQASSGVIYIDEIAAVYEMIP